MQPIQFSQIRNFSDLAKNLSVSEYDLNRLIHSKPQSKFYQQMYIPKKNRALGYRVVYKTMNMTLSLIHKNLETSINGGRSFPLYVQGFVRGRSIVTNAERHLAKKYILNADIKDFFESITIKKVVDAFVNLGCKSEIAEALSKICTVDGLLAQGLSTSPVLANMACREMDKDLLSLGFRYDCEFTRYSDDITFSGNEKIPLKSEIEEIFNKHEFQLNDRKFKLQKRGQSQYVTGLTVFDNKHPRLSKKIKKDLRLTLYYANKYGLKNHMEKIGVYLDEWEINRIDGWIAFMFSVEPELARKFRALWKNILEEYHSQCSEL